MSRVKKGNGQALGACDRLIALLERSRALVQRRTPVSADVVPEPLLRFGLALLRMRIRPALTSGWPDNDPVHISVFGSTNSGKSTLLNLLLGRNVAGMNVTARFSQHPEAYRLSDLGDTWIDDFPSRFPKYARHRDRHPPRQSDTELGQEGYQPAIAVLDPDKVAESELAKPAATDAVLWDAPDFSTELAQHWLDAVLDAVALADIVLLTVTDESYADERGAILFRMVSGSGVVLHVVANKLPDSHELLADIKSKLDENWRGSGKRIGKKRFHHLPLVEGATAEERVERLLSTSEANLLRRAITVEAAQGVKLKREVLTGAASFLTSRQEDILRPLRAEVETAAAWRSSVDDITSDEFTARYKTDYLNGQRYDEFNQALLRLMELLEVPGIGPVIKTLGDIARIPIQLAKGLVKSLLGVNHDNEKKLPEKEALEKLFKAWLAALKAEAQLSAGSQPHPAWTELATKLDSASFLNGLADGFAQAYHEYRKHIDEEVTRRARQIFERIEERPGLLNTLRGANLLGNVAVTGTIVMSGGLSPSDLVLGPAIAGLWRVLITEGLEVYVRGQEQALKTRQLAMMRELIETHLREPVRELFAAGVTSAELDQARSDLAAVSHAAACIARGARP